MNKTKLLIVSVSLAQGGNEKWIYEISKAIDKEKFELGILCSKKYLFTAPEQNFDNYYYHEMKKMDVQMYEYLENYTELPKWRRGINKARRKLYDIFYRHDINMNPQVENLLESFDVICVLDTYNYNSVKAGIHSLREGKFFIVLHSHKIQYNSDPYICFDKDKMYNFTYFCPKQIVEIGTSGLDIEKNKFFFNPLVLNLSNYEDLFNPPNEEKFIIGIFTRIANSKPIDPLLKAFAKIQKQTSRQCLLNIYGEIIDEDYRRHLIQLIADLNIDEKSVHFMGHTNDMASSIKRDKVNLYWGIAINTSIGYASIEIGAMGIPSIFWNWDESSEFGLIEEQTDGAMLVHNRIDDFVVANLKYINEKDSLTELSRKQRAYTIKKHHIAQTIGNFERYVISIEQSEK